MRIFFYANNMYKCAHWFTFISLPTTQDQTQFAIGVCEPVDVETYSDCPSGSGACAFDFMYGGCFLTNLVSPFLSFFLSFFSFFSLSLLQDHPKYTLSPSSPLHSIFLNLSLFIGVLAKISAIHRPQRLTMKEISYWNMLRAALARVMPPQPMWTLCAVTSLTRYGIFELTRCLFLKAWHYSPTNSSHLHSLICSPSLVWI